MEFFTISRLVDYHMLGKTRNGPTILRKIGILTAMMAALVASQGVAGPLDASAAGPPAVLTEPAVADFSGFYGALSFGQINGALTAPPLSSDLDTGEALGLVGGYNWQRGALGAGYSAGDVRLWRTRDQLGHWHAARRCLWIRMG
jgi:hypothetical protein